MQKLVPVPNLTRGLVCNRAEMRARASAGKASSPSGQTISSNGDKKKREKNVRVTRKKETASY